MALFGAHLSSSGSLLFVFERAKNVGAEVIQFFLGSPRSWKRHLPGEDLIREFSKKLKEFKGPVVLHASYLINLASENEELRKRSVDLVLEDLDFCERAGIRYYTLHPGKCESKGKGIFNLMRSLEEIFRNSEPKKTTLLLENQAGGKGDVCRNLEEIGYVVRNFDSKVGVCIDTCHTLSSGYEINKREGFLKFKETLEKEVGIEKVFLIHANDSKFPPGSGRDRHEHIGRGFLGIEGFRNFLTDPDFSKLPYCIETPAEGNMDLVNLRTLRDIHSGKI